MKTLVNHNNNLYTFGLYDDEGRELDLNGRDWSLTLFVSRHNYHPEISIKDIKIRNIEKLTE